MRKEDLVGRKFERLLVLEEHKDINVKRATWKCLCDCGNTTEVLGHNLRKKKNGTKSCGCIRNNNNSLYQPTTAYGEISGGYWSVLKSRCKLKQIKLLITIEQAWEVFLKQNRKCALTGLDIVFVKQYTKDYSLQTASIDRINSDKDYSIDNIQWVHKDINRMKSDLNQEKFISYCKMVSNISYGVY